MIIVDFSNLAVRCASFAHKQDNKLADMSLLRGLILKALKTMDNKYGSKHKLPLTIAVDARGGYWRKEVFPLYKANRKVQKQYKPNEFNYLEYLPMVDQIIEELKEYTPYKVLQIKTCEADDVIAVLAKYTQQVEPCLIMSEDKDFLQIQMDYPKVSQYSSLKNKLLDASEYSLIDHIIGGDAGDGVPNIFSDDDTIITEGKRQKPYTAKLKAKYAQMTFAEVRSSLQAESEELLARFDRNTQLIHLDYIPKNIQEAIIGIFEHTPTHPSKYFNYLVTHRLTGVVT